MSEPAPERTPLSTADELDRLRRIEGRAIALARRWRDGDSPSHAHALLEALQLPEVERER